MLRDRHLSPVSTNQIAGRSSDVGEASLPPRPLERTRTITIVGARGGQGTTTVACTLAVLSAAHGPTTLTTADPDAAAAVFGLPRTTTPPVVVIGSLWLDIVEGTIGTTIVDDGRIGDVPVSLPGPRFAVLRGPCYVAMASLLDHAGAYDGVILVAEHGRSLTAHDVSDVLDVPVVATVHATETVARTVDAGSLVSRAHRLTDLAGLRHLIRPTRTSHQPLLTHTDLQLPKIGNFATRSPCRVRPAQRHVGRAWNEMRRAEHRTAGSERGRVLPGRGRQLG